MNNGESLPSGESARTQARCETSASKRILVVDDEMLIRKICARVLRDFGYLTETAEDGLAAWKALQANVYNLLITDNNMPKVKKCVQHKWHCPSF